MKDSEFLELLNLYLDHEITAADAARLEAEVQASPERRRVYHDYCRMQKACALLAKDFAEQPAERKILAFEPRCSAWGPGLFAGGGLAVAAACVALVLLNRTSDKSPGSAVPLAGHVVVAQAPTIADPAPIEKLPASAIAHAVTVPTRHAEARPMVAPVPLTLAGANTTSVEALLAAMQQQQNTAVQQSVMAQLEWMKSVQLAPIQQLPLDELRLDARSPLQPASRTYSSGHPMQGTVEMTAFRFQR